jgi:hypothetical protein
VADKLLSLFDRAFFIGFLLPVIVFSAVSSALMTWFGMPPVSALPFYSGNNPLLLNVSIAVLALWLAAVLLVLINRLIYRIMEGYGGKWNPAHYLHFLPFKKKESTRRQDLRTEINSKRTAAETKSKEREAAYRRLVRKEEAVRRGGQEDLLEHLREAVSTLDEEITTLEEKRTQLETRLAEQFPVPETSVLPTRFGNVVRSFEEYPRLVYGISSIHGWARLLAVIPKDYQEKISIAKANVDFWVNLWFLSFLTAIVSVAISVSTYDISGMNRVEEALLWMKMASPLLAALLFPFVAAWGARNSAVEWGIVFKASFDVFLPALGKKLGFPDGITHEDEAELWTFFNEVMVHRSETSRALLVKKTIELSEKNRTESARTEVGGTIRELAQQLSANRNEVANFLHRALGPKSSVTGDGQRQEASGDRSLGSQGSPTKSLGSQEE